MQQRRPTLSQLAKGLTLAPGQRYKVMLPKLEVGVFRMEEAYFYPGSAVVLPWRDAEQATGGNGAERLASLSVIAAALRHAKDNPARRLLLAGPSQPRTKTTEALLRGDRDAWGTLCAQHQTVQDLQAVLAWVAGAHGWACHPGGVDGATGANTQAALRRFRARYNQQMSGALALDAERPSAADWRAFFDLMDVSLGDELGDDLPACRSAVSWHDPPLLTCGGALFTGDRVDLMFLEAGKAYPDLCGATPLVQRRDLPVEPPVQLAVKLTDVQGLYKPGFRAEADVDPKASGHQVGYASEDDQGRIFVNHKPRTDPARPWQESVVKDTQYVELVASVQLLQGANIPPGARVQWAWFDPNADDHPETQNHAARVPDRVDVDGRPRTLLNRGTCDFPEPGSPHVARFAQAGACGFAEGANVSVAETEIRDGVSRVRLHVSNVAGDNFVVAARVLGAPRIAPSGTARTGVMTVWKRIDVEYVRMQHAFPLPVDRVPPFFEPACVQMDFAPERVVPSKPFLTRRDGDRQRATRTYASAGQGHFKNAGKPGWFFLAAAERLSSQHASGQRRSEPIYEGTARVRIESDGGHAVETLVVDQVIKHPGSVLTVHDAEGGPRAYACILKTRIRHGKTHFYLGGIDYHSDFDVPRGDGAGRVGDIGRGGAYDKADFYFPRHKERYPPGTWEPGGFGFGQEVFIRVLSGGHVEIGGYSPDVQHEGERYFAGRLLVFTRVHARPSLHVEEALAVIVHEFTHAFGFPHQCGYYAWPEPPDLSCAMNTFVNWVYAPGSRDLQRFVFGTWSPQLCPKHLAGLREVNLEDNPAIWRWT